MIWSSRAPKTVGSNASTAAFAEAESAPFAFCGLEGLDSELDEAADEAQALLDVGSSSSLPWHWSFVSSPAEDEAASLLLATREHDELDLRTDELVSSITLGEQCTLETPAQLPLVENCSAEAVLLESASDVCRG